MNKICAILTCFCLSSCSSSKEDTPKPQPASEKLIGTEEKSNSRVSASAGAIIKANELNTNANSKTAIAAEAGLISATVGTPTQQDMDAAMKRLEHYLGGRVKEAETARASAEKEAVAGREQIETLKKQHKKEVEESKAEIAFLKAKSVEERKENTTLLFAFFGASLASIGALGFAFTPFKRSFMYLIGAGILMGGVAFVWDSVWFQGVIAVCMAAGIIYVIKLIRDKNKNEPGKEHT
jgi:type IV secretory pathway VirB10-like protein